MKANLPKGAQTEDDSGGRYAHWQFRKKLGFNRERLWYAHEPESVVENEKSKFYGISPYSEIT